MSSHTFPAPLDEAPAAPAGLRTVLARVAAFARSEYGLVVAALAAVGVHIVDENYIQPNPGTSAADHLASGLVPLAVLAAVGLLYPHVRAGARATLAMTFGALAVAVGIPSMYYLLNGDASGDHYTGPLAILGGVVLLLAGPVILWRARRQVGSRSRRYALRTVTAVSTLVLMPVLFTNIVFSVGFSYIYTHVGRDPVTPKLGVPYQEVRFATSDDIELAGYYVPSKNRAAVVLFPGSTHSPEARMLIHHGYGVLMVDPRGQGHSEGDVARWANDRDLLAAAEYLKGRADVDPRRIGGIGFSNGGELLLEAAAQSDAYSAVVSEGAGGRMGQEELSGLNKVIGTPQLALMTGALTVFQNHTHPPDIDDRIARIAPRPVFLIYAEHPVGGEDIYTPRFYAAADEPKQLWQVPGAKHTGGLKAQPAEYERRVTEFLDRSLLDS